MLLVLWLLESLEDSCVLWSLPETNAIAKRFCLGLSSSACFVFLVYLVYLYIKIFLKGTQSEGRNWTENVGNVQIFLYFMCEFYQYMCDRSAFFFVLTIWTFWGCSLSHVGLLLASKEWKKVGSWGGICFYHTCWPCSWHHRHRLLDRKWQCFCNFVSF